MQEILQTPVALNIVIIGSLFSVIIWILVWVVIAKPTIINQKW